jgi:hypothetical protein
LLGTLLQVFFRQESGLASRVSNNEASLLGRLDITLEVASNTISNRDKAKLGLIKDVAVFGCQFEQAFRELVIVLLLLDGVVESRVSKVFLSVGNEKGFKFYRVQDKWE